MSWKQFLSHPNRADDLKRALCNVSKKRAAGVDIFPPKGQVLSVFETPLEEIKVVILGQDPYHGADQAHGLAFSVSQGIAIPPSLRNIFKEIYAGEDLPSSGNLEYLSVQGVFLLNSILTVQSKSPGSHKNIGWEEFTDNVIAEISKKRSAVVFMLWGKFAQSKRHLIDTKKHFILETSHPSPFSAHKGFLGCKHFLRCNKILEKQGKKLIIWK